MGLRKDFGVSKENYTTCVPHSINEVVDFSEQVFRFCEKHRISSKKTMAISLCVEEMGTNALTLRTR
ncbi:MAG: hypothetical protein K6F82_01040 [Sphaerochaetaceae bacterium]|nr:hypothetical protein [Sphaerochaetaceae bacterium]